MCVCWGTQEGRVVVSSNADCSSLVFVLLFLLSIGESWTSGELPVTVQPLLHHLSDKRVVPPPGALLHGHQNPALRNAAVHPLPQHPLLLLLRPHLTDQSQNTSTTAYKNTYLTFNTDIVQYKNKQNIFYCI